MKRFLVVILLTSVICLITPGCKFFQKPHITAVSLDSCNFGKETGIPFYLPKPLLIVAKNFRNIEEAKVGLTETAPIPTTYDDQAKYADVNARTNFQGLGSTGETQSGAISTAGGSSAEKSGPHTFSQNGAPVTPGKAPQDGLAPDTFFTYQIVFVPDLTQKYGLKIRGGPGEIRAAMNLVNGWQFTGLGPYYMKDSSTAQNTLSAGISTRLGGQAVADVLNEVNDLAATAAGGQTQGGTIHANDPGVQRLSETFNALPMNCTPMTLTDYAEIYVYEASLSPEGVMTWTPFAEHTFDRQFLGTKNCIATVEQLPTATKSAPVTSAGKTQNGAVMDPIYRRALSQVLGVQADNVGQTQSGGLQNGAVPAAGGVNQIQVECGDGCEKECANKEFNLIKFGSFTPKRGSVQTKVVRANPASFLNLPSTPSLGGPVGGGPVGGGPDTPAPMDGLGGSAGGN